MSDLDFERKHAEDLQRLRGLRLLDDDFMNKVFEDKACAVMPFAFRYPASAPA